MATRESRLPLATARDLLALPEDYRAEIVRGSIVQKAAPTFEHGFTQLKLGARLDGFNGGGGEGGGQGGWWIVTEADIELDTHEVYRPDLCGWRRESMQKVPAERPIHVRPDWVCEILSKSNSHVDMGPKMRTYHRCKVPHYWVVDPLEATLFVYRWNADAYLHLLTAHRGEQVRAEPFEALELQVGALFAPAD
jgi:Uma2 family endonuclease